MRIFLLQPIQRLQPNFVTDVIRNFIGQQKQHKQLILTDSKNIFAYRSQLIQLLQPNFMADGIRNFMAQQKQRKQLVFTDTRIFYLTLPTNTTLTT